MCKKNTIPKRIAEIQKALRQAGFNPRSADGKTGLGTLRAANAFQQEKGLPVNEHLNVANVSCRKIKQFYVSILRSITRLHETQLDVVLFSAIFDVMPH